MAKIICLTFTLTLKGITQNWKFLDLSVLQSIFFLCPGQKKRERKKEKGKLKKGHSFLLYTLFYFIPQNA